MVLISVFYMTKDVEQLFLFFCAIYMFSFVKLCKFLYLFLPILKTGLFLLLLNCKKSLHIDPKGFGVFFGEMYVLWIYIRLIYLIPYGIFQRVKMSYLIKSNLTLSMIIAESEEKLKSLLMKVKVEREKVDLKLNIQKMKIMASGPITSWK